MLFTRWRAPHRSKYRKIELKTPKNSPQEEIHHGCSTSFVVHAKYQGNTKLSPSTERNWEQHIHLHRVVHDNIYHLYIYI